MYKYIIMGIQGCGKGTQAKLLCESYDFAHISIGDIFRWHIANHTKLAAKVNRLISKGDMVPDEMVAQVVAERMTWHDWNYGFVLDGFPRNFTQAEFLLESYNINAVIHLDAPDSSVLQRMVARRVCSSCGLDYNLIHHRPKLEGICDVCQGVLVVRSDDHAEAMKKRISDYHEKTEPMIDLFRQIGILHTVDATGSIDQVFNGICGSLGLPPPRPLNSRTLLSEGVAKEEKAKAQDPAALSPLAAEEKAEPRGPADLSPLSAEEKARAEQAFPGKAAVTAVPLSGIPESVERESAAGRGEMKGLGKSDRKGSGLKAA